VNLRARLRGAAGAHDLVLSFREGVLRGSRNGEAIPDLPADVRGPVVLLGAGPGADRAIVARDGARILVHLRGRVHAFEAEDAARPGRAAAQRHAPADAPFALSPMTGTVASVAVKPGDAVAAGGTLAVVEAMKMQFVVRAPRDVVVAAVPAAAGRPVDIGAVLVEFAP
jgi:biotin carboxyl carrier protein